MAHAQVRVLMFINDAKFAPFYLSGGRLSFCFLVNLKYVFHLKLDWFLSFFLLTYLKQRMMASKTRANFLSKSGYARCLHNVILVRVAGEAMFRFMVIGPTPKFLPTQFVS